MRHVLPLLLSLLCALAPPVHAESAKAIRARAKRYSELGYLSLALQGYERAYQLDADPRTQYVIAQLYYQDGNVEESLIRYRRFLTEIARMEKSGKRESLMIEHALSRVSELEHTQARVAAIRAAEQDRLRILQERERQEEQMASEKLRQEEAAEKVREEATRNEQAHRAFVATDEAPRTTRLPVWHRARPLYLPVSPPATHPISRASAGNAVRITGISVLGVGAATLVTGLGIFVSTAPAEPMEGRTRGQDIGYAIGLGGAGVMAAGGLLWYIGSRVRASAQ